MSIASIADADTATPVSSPTSLGLLQLRAYARRLGKELQVDDAAPDLSAEHFRRFENDVHRIEEGHRAAVDWAKQYDEHSPIVDWLLDNYYVIQEQIREIQLHLPPGFFRQLPKLAKGRARVHVLAEELLLHCDSALDEGLIVDFANHVQESNELTIGETWAYATMLKLVLIERLAYICEQLKDDYQANGDIDGILNSLKEEPRHVYSAIRKVENRGALLRLGTALKEEADDHASVLATFEDHVHSLGWDQRELQRSEQHRLAASQVSIGNIITSLRLLSGVDWATLFEDINCAERILRKDEVYPQMDFGTRNRYRTAVESIAKGCNAVESKIAQTALSLAQNSAAQRLDVNTSIAAAGSPSNDAIQKQPAIGIDIEVARSHIGYWLIDDGRIEIERLLNYVPSLSVKLQKGIIAHPAFTYFGSLATLTTVIGVIYLLLLIRSGVTSLFALLLTAIAILPISELVLTFINSILTRVLPVKALPKFDFEEAIPETTPAFVVVPCMLSSSREVKSLLTKIENHFLSNNDPSLCFGLLSDFTDASTEHHDHDQKLIAEATAGIRRLNEIYVDVDGRSPFYLFHRRRRWNPSEKKWMAWERKRGKLIQFGAYLLHGDESQFTAIEGDRNRFAAFRDPHNVPYVITVDSDTIIPRDSAKKLVGTAAHPLNRPVIDRTGDDCLYKVKRGYTVFQPRVSIHMSDEARSRYLKIQGGQPGLDPYASAASDVYQDLFGEGSFTGKGIYDLRVFEAILHERFPENRILSHDLIEGCHTRVGLVSDVEVFDGYPSRYDADAKRHHRWARGDWQIASWLYPRVPRSVGKQINQLSLISRWKIFDNLRRSLVAPALVLMLFATWVTTSSAAFIATVLAISVLFFPMLIQGVAALFSARLDIDLIVWGMNYAREFLRVAEACVYQAAFLPHRAVSMLDAIIRTFWRLLISNKKLLEWETAAAVEEKVTSKRWAVAKQLWVCTACGLLSLLLLRNGAFWSILPWSLLWIAAPILGHRISLPKRKERETINSDARKFLLEIVSGTWGYFERYVCEAGRWLPPDNVQEYPRETVAYRISPTNEGLFLVSALTAHRLGFAATSNVVGLLEKNLKSWLELPVRNGHHFNWYETKGGTTLPPRYISTVDSGNLLASYLTFIDGVTSLVHEPIIRKNHLEAARASIQWARHVVRSLLSHSSSDSQKRKNRQRQIEDLSLLLNQEEFAESLDDGILGAVAMCESFLRTANRIERSLAISQESMSTEEYAVIHDCLVIVAQRLRMIDADIRNLFPWMFDSSIDVKLGADIPSGHDASDWRSVFLKAVSMETTLAELVQLPKKLESIERERSKSGTVYQFPDQLKSSVRRGALFSQELIERIYLLRKHCETAASLIDFRFLYNHRRKLFSIGFNVETNSLDKGHYDLLCSECRLSSYLAVAKGDVETEHWFRLGRPTTKIGNSYALLSWGGTMFEYLMPPLFQRIFPSSLLEMTCKTSVERQAEYGKQHRTPWGISESAFSAMSANSDYQYKSFGVPGLGLKRGLSRDHVISPYSSALALPIDPQRSIANLQLLSTIALGSWGFYDAVDYTPSRLRKQESYRLVRNYMAHHQGMTLLAIANTIDNQIVQRWFHAHPMVRANELLLQERVPSAIVPQTPNPDEVEESSFVRTDIPVVSRQIRGYQSATPKTCVLSNGHFTSMISHTGGSYCQFDNTQITRWRSDGTRDCWGTFLYLKDIDSRAVWSATYQPTYVEPDDYEVLFSIDKAEIRRQQGDIETMVEIVVSPEHNAEVRQVRLTNHGKRKRNIEITSYAEVALNQPSADSAHPAFQKLFIETEYIAEDTSLIARRRPRDKEQSPSYAVHTIAVPHDSLGDVQYETSREKFLGRNRTIEDPRALDSDDLGGTTGAVIDPIFSLRARVAIEVGESITVAFTTAYAESREQALFLADIFHDLRGVQRTLEMAWAYAQLELRHLNQTPKQIHLYQQLGSALLYLDRRMRPDADAALTNQLPQNSLWRFGISGDKPFVLLRIEDTTEIELVNEVLAAQAFLKSKGLQFDVVICNDYPGTYFDSLQEEIQDEINTLNSGDQSARSIFVLRGPQLSVQDHNLLNAAAHVHLHGKRGKLVQQLTSVDRYVSDPGRMSKSRSTLIKSHTVKPAQNVESSSATSLRLSAPNLSESPLMFDNGFGGFRSDRYRIHVRPETPTPSPWSNVLANPQMGTLVTEGGGGFSWFGNSRENKMTVWSNDAVSDPPSEVVYFSEKTSETIWSPNVNLGYPVERVVEHGQGFSTFEDRQQDITTTTEITIDRDLALKFTRLKFHNESTWSRTLKVTYYAETILGVSREATAMHQVSEYDAANQCLKMRSGFNAEASGQVVFLKAIGDQASIEWTADRRSFLGRLGSWTHPIGLSQGLEPTAGAGADPCLAISIEVTLQANSDKELIFVLGAAKDNQDYDQLQTILRNKKDVLDRRDASLEYWNQFLDSIKVITPNKAFDLIVNRWLPYQTLACRIWGRSAFYQCGGAYGFRDQLQDVMALVYARPDLAREQIFKAAARQYAEGDVQHWWHPPTGRGTRTRFSDDFLFLPFVVMHYLRVTNDDEILKQRIPFLRSPLLNENEHERYELPQASEEDGTVLEHCVRALRHGMRYGEHDLPLMGCGDWNDGMSRVGEKGRGESVWVAWFQIKIFEEFVELFDRAPYDPLFRDHLKLCVEKLRDAIERHAWDSAWYRRAFFDDGTPLGSFESEECQIDSLAQSWSVIVNGDTEHSQQAFNSAIDRLFDRKSKLMLLFVPPFDKGDKDPGYIQGYLPGVRENGGQYTHGALWMIQAATRLGKGDVAMEIFDALNPIHHSDTRSAAEIYKVEPYVVAADVYSNPQHVGRGGWTWYTGSSAWMYRVAIEDILGFTKRGNTITFNPVLPKDWTGFEFEYRFGKNTLYRFKIVVQPTGTESKKPQTVTLIDDGKIHDVTLPSSSLFGNNPSAEGR